MEPNELVEVEMVPDWNKYMGLFQYGPEEEDLRCMIGHCHPKGDRWVDEGDTQAREQVISLMRMHGFNLKWVEPAP